MARSLSPIKYPDELIIRNVNGHPRAHIQSGHFDYYLGANDIAALVNVTYKTALRWLHGHQNPSPQIIELLYLKACKRVLPATKQWQKIYIDADQERIQTDGSCMYLAEVQDYLWTKRLQSSRIEALEKQLNAANEEIDRLRSFSSVALAPSY